MLAASTPLVDGPAGVLLREFPGGVLAQPGIDPWDEEGSVVLALATTGDDPHSRLRAGEATSAVLLTVTDLGLATTPLSQALEIADTRTAIADDVLAGAAVPQLLLRVGWAPTSAPPLPAGPRRPRDRRECPRRPRPHEPARHARPVRERSPRSQQRSRPAHPQAQRRSGRAPRSPDTAHQRGRRDAVRAQRASQLTTHHRLSSAAPTCPCAARQAGRCALAAIARRARWRLP